MTNVLSKVAWFCFFAFVGITFALYRDQAVGETATQAVERAYGSVN